MPEPTTSRAAAVDAWEAIHRTEIVLGRQLYRQPEFTEVSAREYDALFNLTRAGREGLRLRDLNEYLPVTQSSLSRMIERLERRGLVSTWQDPDDGRGLRIGLTDDGHGVLARVGRDHEDHVHALLAGHLTTDELRTLTDLITKLRPLENTP